MAEAGITAADASPTGRSTTSVAVAPSGSGRGVAGFRRARKVRVCAAACGESSRNTTSNGWSGALVERTPCNCDALNAASRSSGTSTTISGSPSFAIETIGWPSATTWPTSNFTAVTTPSCDARSVVYSSRLRARSSFRASASAVARVVCALLCAFSSSEGLTEPSIFSASSRLSIRLRLPGLRRRRRRAVAARLPPRAGNRCRRAPPMTSPSRTFWPTSTLRCTTLPATRKAWSPRSATARSRQ